MIKSYLKEIDEAIELLEKCLLLDANFFPAKFELCKLKCIYKSEEFTFEQKEYIEKHLSQYNICYYDFAIIILNTKNINQKVIFL